MTLLCGPEQHPLWPWSLKYLSMSQNLKLLKESGIKSWKNPRYPGVHHLWTTGCGGPQWRSATRNRDDATVDSQRVLQKRTHSMRRRQSYEILRNPKFPQTHLIHFPWLFMTTIQYNQHKVILRSVSAKMTRPVRILSHLGDICCQTWGALILTQANSVIATFNVSSPTFEPNY